MILSSRLNPCICNGSADVLNKDLINGEDIKERYFIKPFYQIFNNKDADEKNKGQFLQQFVPH